MVNKPIYKLVNFSLKRFWLFGFLHTTWCLDGVAHWEVQFSNVNQNLHLKILFVYAFIFSLYLLFLSTITGLYFQVWYVVKVSVVFVLFNDCLFNINYIILH